MRNELERSSHLQGFVFTKWSHTLFQISSHLVKGLFVLWSYLYPCLCLAHDVMAVEACVEACDSLCQGAPGLCSACGFLGYLLTKLGTVDLDCGVDGQCHQAHEMSAHCIFVEVV